MSKQDIRSNSSSDDIDDGELITDDESHSSSAGYTSEEGEVLSDCDEAGYEIEPKSPVEETPWQRGLRLAREKIRRAHLLRMTDENVEEKKLKLVVTAPVTDEDDLAVNNERSDFSDVLWSNYYKLSIVGYTQLTGRRVLPSDLEPPSAGKLNSWRRRCRRRDIRHRSCSLSPHRGSGSSSVALASPLRSRSSSLSSIAASILLAVPELAADDESDREMPRRTGGRSSASSNTGRSQASSSADRRARGSSIRQRRLSNYRTRRRGKRFASPRPSRSSTRSSSAISRRRPQSPPTTRPLDISAMKHFPKSGGVPRDRRPLAYFDQRSAQCEVAAQLQEVSKSVTHAQTEAPIPRKAQTTEPSYLTQPPPTNLQSTKSPQREIALLPHIKPVKRPWVADPSNPVKISIRVPEQLRQSRFQQSSSSPSPGAEKTTFITSWSQASSSSGDLAAGPKLRGPEKRVQQSRSIGPALHCHRTPGQLPDVVPDCMVNIKSARSAGDGVVVAESRRKSRSPFGDLRLSNPSQVAPLAVPPYEETAPLLAGSVNPINPVSALHTLVRGQPMDFPIRKKTALELPSAASRPGVKLTLPPRTKAPIGLPGVSGSTRRQVVRQFPPSGFASPPQTKNVRGGQQRDYQPGGRYHDRGNSTRIGPSASVQETGPPKVRDWERGKPAEREPRRGERRNAQWAGNWPFGTPGSPVSSASRLSPSPVSPRSPDPLRRGKRQRVEEHANQATAYQPPAGKRQRGAFNNAGNAYDNSEYPYGQQSFPKIGRWRGSANSAYTERLWARNRGGYADDKLRVRNGEAMSRQRNEDRRRREMGTVRNNFVDRGQASKDRRSMFDVEASGAYPTEPRARRGFGLAPLELVRHYERSNDLRRPGWDDASYRQRGGRPTAREETRPHNRPGREERSRSPFESLRREDGDAAERRLQELRQRLTMVDDAIAEIKAHSSTAPA